LRDDPKPLYPIEGVAAFDDVGYRGEHTAAVLDANRNRIVQYIGAPEAGSHRLELDIRYSPLQEAVVNWLVYLGVAQSVSTLDRGKLGHELKVRSDPDGHEHDLTNVGVGVSQVLPIVVMALVAPRGSTLIFEQPELHLHPRVQTRLADFFVCMATLGKQCLIETHSEYLIHRLRLRIAQDESSKTAHLARLYFIEREGRGAACRDVRINEYGVILDWPKDFFDQTQDEIDQIMDAAAEKSRLRKK
jgi:predicted ATPase